MKKFLLIMVVMLLSFSNPSFARGGAEDQYMISNGQGISSPSYWNALEGQNPAGIVLNTSKKIQLGAGSFNNTNQPYGSGGFLIGNGILGAGAEYWNKANSATTKGQINWSLGGKIQAIHTAFGVSSRTSLENGSSGIYDLGILTDVGSNVRFGFMIPNFTNTINTFAAGLTFMLDSTVDFVVDADYNSTSSIGLVKPGLNFHSQSLHASVSYGLNYKGSGSSLLWQQLTAGLGFKLGNSLLVSYEYRGVVDHRVGLTLRFN